MGTASSSRSSTSSAAVPIRLSARRGGPPPPRCRPLGSRYREVASMIVGAATDALDEDPLLGKTSASASSRSCRRSGRPPDAVRRADRIGARPSRARRPASCRRASPRSACTPLRDRSRASRAEQGDDHRGSDRAEDVGDGIGDRHAVEQVLGFLGRQAEAVDRVGAEAHRRRDRLRARVEPYRRPDVVAGQLGDEVGGR